MTDVFKYGQQDLIYQLNQLAKAKDILDIPQNSAAAAASAAASAAAAAAAAESDGAAATAASKAAAALKALDARYLGAKALPPDVDNNGGALLAGATYWDTVLNGGCLRVFQAGAWVTIPGNVASQISSTPVGAIIAKNVQAALAELDFKKAARATTLAGYGIADALPGSYVPTWASITGKPQFAAVAASGSKVDVGLGNVDNTTDAAKPVSAAQQVAINLKAPLASPAFTGNVTGITKAMVTLGNVDNTSDINKPVSTAQQTALNLKANVINPSTTGRLSHNGERAAINSGADYWTTFQNSKLSNSTQLFYSPTSVIIGLLGLSGAAIPFGDGGAFAIRSTGALLLESDTNVIVPARDGIMNLGYSSFRWGNSYFSTAPTITSDVREKTDFRDLNEAEIAAARALARIIGVYRWKTAVDLKGTEAREHIGPTVQRAIDVMLAHGLDPFNYGFICYDKWEAKTIEHDAVEDEDPQIARAAWTESILAGDRYAFRYDELNQFILAGMEAAQTAIEAQLAPMLARAH